MSSSTTPPSSPWYLYFITIITGSLYPGYSYIQYNPGYKEPVIVVMKYKYQGLPGGVCKIIDILRQFIKTFPEVCKYMCVVSDIQNFTKDNKKF